MRAARASAAAALLLCLSAASPAARAAEAAAEPGGSVPPTADAPAPGSLFRRIGEEILVIDLHPRPGVDPVSELFSQLGPLRPNGTAWAIAPRINTRGARVGALFRRPQVSGLSEEEGEAGYFFSQPLPSSTGWKYTGRTAMLIDARAISQAEHTGLFFEAANDTVLVGTATAGTNGDVTNLSLPGNVRVVFTGHDVRHADGRQLQGIGLEPDVEAAPTLQGLREGRDEVLERAIRHLGG